MTTPVGVLLVRKDAVPLGGAIGMEVLQNNVRISFRDMLLFTKNNPSF
ncbi:hypothetical protein CHELA1G11_13090 [Hyphomicrobiales bacterium]|nr:hypothetical protein CHELA1G2_11219 [Hyphomicrobiales bacterium]CAH1669236.1 hypothetical protein CHELA1G11_13090 [Hyphomicrobiales bacterium]